MQQPPTACKNCQHAPCDCKKTAQTPTLRWSKKTADVDLALNCTRWRDFVKTFSAYNITCQHIGPDGQRCAQPGKIVHHIIGRHTDPSKMYDPANTVRVCREHHPPSDGDSPDASYSWSPTKWRYGFEPAVEIEHPRPAKLDKGEVKIESGGVARIG